MWKQIILFLSLGNFRALAFCFIFTYDTRISSFPGIASYSPFLKLKGTCFYLHYPFSSKIQTIRNQSTLTNKSDLMYNIKRCNLFKTWLIFVQKYSDSKHSDIH